MLPLPMITPYGLGWGGGGGKTINATSLPLLVRENVNGDMVALFSSLLVTTFAPPDRTQGEFVGRNLRICFQDDGTRTGVLNFTHSPN